MRKVSSKVEISKAFFIESHSASRARFMLLPAGCPARVMARTLRARRSSCGEFLKFA